MKSDRMKHVMRALMTCLGIGAGSVLAYLMVQVQSMTSRDPASVSWLVMLYLGLGLGGGLMGFLLTPRVMGYVRGFYAWIEEKMAALTFAQQLSSTLGGLAGLLVATLLSQLLRMMGTSMFSFALTAILFVVMGGIGVRLGYQRSEEFGALLAHFPGEKKLRKVRSIRKKEKSCPAKVIDDTALIDGRILGITRAGFLEGALLVPQGVQQELNRLAQSDDTLKRVRGEKGLDTLEGLRETGQLRLIADAQLGMPLTSLLPMMAKERQGVIVTCDTAMTKAAGALGVRVMNINDLACALRPVASAGDRLSVHLVKSGREPSQGVGFLEDGTMTVVEGGRDHIGETVEVTVSSVLQTSAGRMIFAKMTDTPEK